MTADTTAGRPPVTHFPADPAGPRSSIDMLISMQMTNELILAALEHIRTAVRESSDSRSSASVKDSARGYDLEVKSYADGLLPTALDDAMREYARGKHELKALAENGWAESVKQAKADRETEVAAGRRWADQQSQTEAADGDQVV